jgi:hypothetical protein
MLATRASMTGWSSVVSVAASTQPEEGQDRQDDDDQADNVDDVVHGGAPSGCVAVASQRPMIGAAAPQHLPNAAPRGIVPKSSYICCTPQPSAPTMPARAETRTGECHEDDG